MRSPLISILGAAALLVVSGSAFGAVCTNLGITVDVDGTSQCAGPIVGNIPPYDLNNPSDNPDMGLGFTDWVSLEKDDLPNGLDSGLLRIELGADNIGRWMYTGTQGADQLLLVLKFGNEFATFLVSGAVNTWYDWSITPAQGNGLSHMELFGRGAKVEVPEPTTLGLLGLGLAGLGLARRRKAAA
jgi:hypothetical protein